MSDTATGRQTVFTGPENATGRQTVFRHVIHFRMYEGTTQETVDEALRLMVVMAQTPEVLHYEVALSEDTRKGIVLIEFFDFADREAFEAFKATDAHQAYAAFIREHAHWSIADYVVPV